MSHFITMDLQCRNKLRSAIITVLFLCRSVTFRLEFLTTGRTCDLPGSVDKGVEFSILGEDGIWVPLAYYHWGYDRRPEIRVGNFSLQQQSSKYNYSIGIRGYDVPAHNIDSSYLASLEICDPTYLGQSHAQFRWLETARHPKNNTSPVDVWGLDNVTIVHVRGNTEKYLVQDDFDSQEVLK